MIDKLTQFLANIDLRQLLSRLTLVLAVILLPPASLAWASQNAIPGDSMYPVKRSLEAVILRFYRYQNPYAETAYQISLGDKRFKEAASLLAQRDSYEGLPSLVNDVRAAKLDVKNLEDPGQKAQLKQDLDGRINEYINGLIMIDKQRQKQVVARPTQPIFPTMTTAIFPTQPLAAPTETIGAHPTPPFITPTPTPTNKDDQKGRCLVIIDPKIKDTCDSIQHPESVDNGGQPTPTPTLTLTPTPFRCPNAQDCSKISASADLVRRQCAIDNENLAKLHCVLPTHSGGPQSVGADEESPTPTNLPSFTLFPTSGQPPAASLPSNTPVPASTTVPVNTVPPPPPTSTPIPATPAVKGAQDKQVLFCFLFFCFH